MGRSVRCHFTVPNNDMQILEWIKVQNNFSTSMRMLIKNQIAKHGMTDVSCMTMQINEIGSNLPITRMEEPAEPPVKQESVAQTPVVQAKPEDSGNSAVDMLESMMM